MTNIFELLPPEILRHIISDLNHKHMTMAYYSCKTFQRLNLKLLIKERGIKGYPRHQGYCKNHEIPEMIIHSEHDAIINDRNSKKILNYLYDIDADLIKGDFITLKCCIGMINDGCNTGISIFDGIKIINLSGDYYECGHIPKDFTVIYDGVPLKYWWDSDALGNDACIIWFNPYLVRGQCIDNIKYGLITNDNFAIYTSFEYETIIYTIIFDYVDELADLFSASYELPAAEIPIYIEAFIKLLSRNKEVCCKHYSDNYLIDVDTTFLM